MQDDYINLYAKCRKSTQMTQERWAEALDVSVETVKAWERDLRVPSHYQVCRMVDLCRDPWLAYQHLKATADCLGVLPEAKKQPLPIAAIKLINRVMQFADKHRGQQLLEIAEDGVIDTEERALFDEIVRELNELVSAAYGVRYAEEDAYGQKK